MLTIVDCGVGNVGSVANMLKRLGSSPIISDDPETIGSASKLILPGVGAFDQGMLSLRARRLEGVLRDRCVVGGVPILGICLGMQMLGHSSEEGREPGLGWIKGRCEKFGGDDWDPGLKVPHMGWNAVTRLRSDDPLLEGIGDAARFYFVHSYRMVFDDPALCTGVTVYGDEFPAVLRAKNIHGVQFHPEKSHRFGLALLKNFLERC